MLLTVRSNRALSREMRLLGLEWPEGAGRPQPGQFVMVRTREGTDPLWRRPLGVHDLRRGRGRTVLELLYEVVGPTTRDLAALRRGSRLDLLGPLGRGFAADPRERWMVAGGRGVAPLLLLARSVRARGIAARLFVGGRDGGHVVREEVFARIGCRVDVATDDGSRGHHGFVTALLERALAELPAARRPGILVSACGPPGMLAAVAGLAARHGVAAEVSVDPLMACGQGLCFGCTVRAKDGHRLACRQGPVFRAEELVW